LSTVSVVAIFKTKVYFEEQLSTSTLPSARLTVLAKEKQ